VLLNHKVHAVVGVLGDDVDPMVNVMKLEKAPQETYADIGGLDTQIQEIKESVELPLTHPEYYEEMGIRLLPTKRQPLFFELSARSSFRNISAMAPSWYVNCSVLLKNMHLPLSSLTRLMLLELSDTTLILAVNARFNVLCWSFLISWMVSIHAVTSR